MSLRLLHTFTLAGKLLQTELFVMEIVDRRAEEKHDRTNRNSCVRLAGTQVGTDIEALESARPVKYLKRLSVKISGQ